MKSMRPIEKAPLPVRSLYEIITPGTYLLGDFVIRETLQRIGYYDNAIYLDVIRPSGYCAGRLHRANGSSWYYCTLGANFTWKPWQKIDDGTLDESCLIALLAPD